MLKFWLRFAICVPCRLTTLAPGNGTITHTLNKCSHCLATHVSLRFSDANRADTSQSRGRDCALACFPRDHGKTSPSSFVDHQTLGEVDFLAPSAHTGFNSRYCLFHNTTYLTGLVLPFTTKSMSRFQFPLTI